MAAMALTTALPYLFHGRSSLLTSTRLGRQASALWELGLLLSMGCGVVGLVMLSVVRLCWVFVAGVW